MAKDFFINKIPHNGMTFEKYSELADEKVNNEAAVTDEKEKELLEYTKLNVHRTGRINKTYKVSEELKEVISKIGKKQLWMMITEDWCGDSAQNLPYIAKMAEESENIDLKIIYRDENLDIMDQYLTNGTSRSIPKLVAFDEDGEELFQWGPRPQELVELVEQWKTEMEPKEWKEKIQLFYGRNRGKAIEQEFIDLLK
ncbi:MAG: thioredoxin family protein [Rhodothermaceae bacterium]